MGTRSSAFWSIGLFEVVEELAVVPAHRHHVALCRAQTCRPRVRHVRSGQPGNPRQRHHRCDPAATARSRRVELIEYDESPQAADRVVRYQAPGSPPPTEPLAARKHDDQTTTGRLVGSRPTRTPRGGWTSATATCSATVRATPSTFVPCAVACDRSFGQRAGGIGGLICVRRSNPE